MNSPAFDVWSTALLLMLVILWAVMNLFTIKGIVTGKLLGLERGWKVPKNEHQTV
jgi:sodium-dependent phosphate transporter